MGETKLSEPNTTNTSSLNTPQTTKSTSTYSTPSVLSTQASTASSMDATPEPIQLNLEPIKSKPDKIAVIIDYSSIEMEVKHECKCGYVLSDAQIMVGWCSEFTNTNNLRCIMCRQNAFAPKLHLRYSITKMSMQNGICSFETIDKYIEYISPL